MPQTTIKHPASEARDAWFENLLATIDADRFMLEANVAPADTTRLYNDLINGNTDALVCQSQEMVRKHFISRMLVAYLQILHKERIQPSALAFDLNNHEVLVWATIPDDDEAMERSLILAEARVNAQFHPNGFDLTSTIVEQSDALPLPNHYTAFSVFLEGNKGV